MTRGHNVWYTLNMRTHLNAKNAPESTQVDAQKFIVPRAEANLLKVMAGRRTQSRKAESVFLSALTEALNALK